MKAIAAAFALTASLFLAGAARAQSIDETVSFLNQYGENGSFKYTNSVYQTASSPFSFIAPATLVYRFTGCDLEDGRRTNCMAEVDRVNFAMVTSIALDEQRRVVIRCEVKCAVLAVQGGYTINAKKAIFGCHRDSCDRMLSALEHLKSLVGNDPFAQ